MAMDIKIDYETHRRINQRLCVLNKEIKSVGMKIHLLGQDKPEDWNSRVSDANRELARLKSDRKRLQELEAIYREKNRLKLDRSDEGLREIFRNARELIKKLHKEYDIPYSADAEDVCDAMHTIDDEWLQNDAYAWLSPSEVKAIRQDYENRIVLQQTKVANLQIELTRQQRKQRADLDMLRDLWDMQFEEPEEWRHKLGHTHRIHLDADLRQRIKDILDGVARKDITNAPQ